VVNIFVIDILILCVSLHSDRMEIQSAEIEFMSMAREIRTDEIKNER
jgi:hypothetical protein